MKLQVFLITAAVFCMMIPLLVTADDICTQTGDVRFGGTDEDIYCMLFGDQGSTDWDALDKLFRNDFERGNYDCFPIEDADKLGVMIQKIGIKFVGDPGRYDDWYLSRVEINFKGKCFKFNFDTWITSGNNLLYKNATGYFNDGHEKAIIMRGNGSCQIDITAECTVLEVLLGG